MRFSIFHLLASTKAPSSPPNIASSSSCSYSYSIHRLCSAQAFVPMPAATQFDHERLDVYQIELRFVTWVTDLLRHVRESNGPETREVRDQLDRASLSMLLNTAEGNGKRGLLMRARFFDDARGSATECAACLDALVAKKMCGVERVAEGKALLLRVVSILCKLVERFDPEMRGTNEQPHSRTSTSRRTRTIVSAV